MTMSNILVEFIRRLIWIIIRVENEQNNNFEDWR
jgi:hypothetical protein